jgi:hypothetical protein
MNCPACLQCKISSDSSAICHNEHFKWQSQPGRLLSEDICKEYVPKTTLYREYVQRSVILFVCICGEFDYFSFKGSILRSALHNSSIILKSTNSHSVHRLRLPVPYLQPVVVPAGHGLVVDEDVVVVAADEGLCSEQQQQNGNDYTYSSQYVTATTLRYGAVSKLSALQHTTPGLQQSRTHPSSITVSQGSQNSAKRRT